MLRRSLPLLLLLPTAALAQKVTVTGGKHDAANVVVIVPGKAPGNMAVANGIPGNVIQQTGDNSLFVLPKLKAGESLTLDFLYAKRVPPAVFSFKETQGEYVDLLLGDRPVPQHAGELAELPWLALRTFYRDEVELTHAGTGETVSFPIRPRLSTDGLQAIRNAAILGLGAAIASQWALVDDLAARRLVQLAPDWRAATLPVSLVYPPSRHQPARLRRFIEVMRIAVPLAFRAVQAP